MIKRVLSAVLNPTIEIKQFTSLSSPTSFRLHNITRSVPADNTVNMFSYLNPLPHLSKYRGPQKVGSTEFEIPVSEIQSSSTVPDSRVTTIKFRIFYPISPKASSKQSIPWLPTPQKIWTQAYAQFMGISEGKATWISKLPSVLSYATIPAVQNAPLLELSESKTHPLMIFSHGLGGNYNTYSSLLGNLASCGIICVAPEHRDGSAPISMIKSSHNKVQTTIEYEKVAHQPTAEVLNARNAMLRIRLWELELVYSAISQMNQGKQFTNLVDTVTETSKSPNLVNAVDLKPGRVTWGGHSFGSATTVQFIKSVYYHKQAPPVASRSSDSTEWDMTPLYTPSANSELIKQVTPTSPIVLLDLWTMPLRGAATRWLWEKPLPCHDRTYPNSNPSVISIMSAEFHKWTDLLTRTRATLSTNPEESLTSTHHQQTASSSTTLPTKPTPTSSSPPPVETDLHEPAEPELMPIRTTSSLDAENPPVPDRTPIASRSPSPPPSTNATTTTRSSPSPAHLYLVPHSAHLSQSDFGPLFPNFTRYFMKALDPEKTIELNVRAIVAMLRSNGIPVEALDLGNGADVDRILDESVVIDRWVRVKL